MVHRALMPMNGCPNCGQQPKVKITFFRGSRMECRCGVAGPFVWSDWPEHDAREAWSAIAGHPILHRPKPPAGFGQTSGRRA